MSWLLKQAEDILNRVDQQTNAAINQHQLRSNSQQPFEPLSNDTDSFSRSKKSNEQSISNIGTTLGNTRRSKKQEEADLLDYLNSSTPVSKKSDLFSTASNTLSDATRTASSPNMKRSDSTTSINENLASKSESATPRSRTPASASHEDDEGLVLNVPSISVESTSESLTTKKTSENDVKDDIIASLHSEIQLMMRDKRSYEKELQNYKRQQIQYQQQIAESDALLRDLRSREADSVEALSAKDSQIALLRVHLAESDEFVKSKTALCEQLQNQCARILQDHTDSTGLQSQAFDSLQLRLNQLEQEYQQRVHESERLMDEKQSFEKHANEEKHQLIEQLKTAEKRLHDERLQFHEQQQQVKHSKNTIHQLEQDMQDYKAKAQRILQTKDKLIEKLKEIAQSRSNSKSFDDLQDSENSSMNDETKLFDVHHVGNSSILTPGTVGSSPWASVQYEELKAENELFKQELQARELTIHTLRRELQEADLLVQHAENQLREQCDQLQEQLKDERMRLTLAEQDCRKLKQELAFVHEDFHRQKQVHLTQLNEREREMERLRLQLTAKTINHVNDDELEKRLQTLTESLIHKQTIIEALQTEKSSLTLQLERFEKRLEDYERISSMNVNNSSNSSSSSKRLQATTINMEMDSNSLYDNDHDDNLRYRIPMLRETPYDPDIAKKVKRAANEIDKLGIRLGIFLKRYPAVRLGVIFYAILLHLWTIIVLFTYKPEIHGNLHPLDFPHSS